MLLLPIVIAGAVLVRSGSARISEWLPKNQLDRITYDSFIEMFGDDRFVLVSWEGCSTDDQRLNSISDELRQLDSNHTAAWFFNITSTRTLIEHLTNDPLKLTEATAKRRIEGFMLGRDGTACLVIELTPTGITNGTDAIECIYQAAEVGSGLQRGQMRLVGPVFEEAAIDRAGNDSMRYLVPPSTLAAILVAVFALGRWRASLVVFLLAGLGQIMSVALVYYVGAELSAVMIVLPTLVFMLSLSSCVHLVNYYDEIADGEQHRGARAVLMGLKPTMLATATTMAGMGSLVVSDLGPVKAFGLYSAISLGMSTLALLLLFPQLTAIILREQKRSERISTNGITYRDTFLESLTSIVTKHAGKITLVAILCLGICIWGTLRLQASTKFDKMFPAASPAVTGMNWVESKIGPIVSVEVLLTFPEGNQDLLQQVRWLSTIESQLRQSDDVGATLSAAKFLPAISRARGARGTLERAAYAGQLNKALYGLTEQKWLAQDQSDRNVWRITCKVTALDEDYGIFVERLRQDALSSISEFRSEPFPPEKVEITGVSVMAYNSQLQLTSDLSRSFTMAFLLITPMMMFVTRSVSGGLIAMMPNVLPVLIVFGLMGLTQIKVDIAGILTASVALGIAVDDTLHFVSWYRRGQSTGLGARDSIRFAYRHCAMAMIETTLICCSAMLPLLFAGFIPTARFAALMVCMLLLAIVGDLLVLPALLVVRDRWTTPAISTTTQT